MILDAVNVFSLNNDSSIIGDFTLPSTKISKTKPTKLMAKLDRIMAELQPYSLPSKRPNVKPPKAKVKNSIPSQSISLAILKSYVSSFPKRMSTKEIINPKNPVITCPVNDKATDNWTTCGC